MKVGIYKITNNINGKFYIGQSRNLARRKLAHAYSKRDSLISKAIQKYGWNNFLWEILEYCTEGELDAKEQYYIDLYRPYDLEIGYNILPIVGINPMLGRKHRPESIQKMRDNITKKFGQSNHFYGKSHSQETKKIMSDIKSKTSLGKNNNFYGKTHSAETKELISAKHRGVSNTKCFKKVVQIDKYTGKEVCTWLSIRFAAEHLGSNSGATRISAVCRGKLNSALGFSWKYF